MLLLDSSLRDFVLLPLFALMFLVGLARHYLTIGDPPKPTSDLSKIFEMQLVKRSAYLRAYGNRIPYHAFSKRKQYFNADEGQFTTLAAKPKPNPLGSFPSFDLSSVGSMMKRNVVMIATNLFFFSFVEKYFSGFVSVKLPFGLSEGFKDMFQKGIDLQSLDVSYVSSTSWYILTLFGIKGLTTLALGSENAMDDTAMAMNPTMMMMGGMMNSGGQEIKFQSEKDSLELVHWSDDLANSEENILKLL